jgi:predicted esterase
MPTVVRRLRVWFAASARIAALLATAPVAVADRVELADGRVLDGGFAMVGGVADNPLEDGATTQPAAQPIVVCDYGLTRTMVSKRQVVRTERSADALGTERLSIPQLVPEKGRRVVGIGSILAATPFDEYGRRTLSLATANGRVDVVQGITEITPRWIKVEGLQTEKPLVLDMRMATSSVPRDVLSRVIATHLDRGDSEERLRLVRLLLQSERYADARAELDEVLRDFPDLAHLAAERRTLARLAAGQMHDELLLRGRAGQDRFAIEMLDAFPVDDAAPEVLQSVKESRDDYRRRQEQAARLVAVVRERLTGIDDADDRAAATAIVAEIEQGLSFATLGRLATFEQLGTDQSMSADRAVALAINGWRQTAGNAANLKAALSAVRVRDLVRDFLRTDDAGRRAVLTKLRDEEAFDAATVASVAAAMRPPLDPPEPTAPGLFELAVPQPGGGPEITCLVQLPPEYDPLRRYPAVVSLHSAVSTPLNQIEWWAGPPGPDGLRRGQATRQGTIVIAPAWGRQGQSSYEASAREHAAVLTSLRAALRRFAIDTDRVFLSGHSLGGDAAWDIALAHPDLWAGLIMITPTADRYVRHYWPNARQLPIYVVGGELDGTTIARNTVDLDRYLDRGFDMTYVEYRGRGHEHYSDEILRLFDWMGRKRRTFFPQTIDVVSMRPWDRFFWWVEMESAPPRTVVLPTDWPPPANTRPLSIEAKVGANNSLAVRCGAERVQVWLAPELIDFTRPVTVTIDSRQAHSGRITPDIEVMLEDLRLRADRQHPFWAVVETTKKRSP